jgi:two-component system, OmpR family, response regulator RpaA
MRIAAASEDELEMEKLSEYGYSDAFKKPFDIALLAERIRTLVEQQCKAI